MKRLLLFFALYIPARLPHNAIVLFPIHRYKSTVEHFCCQSVYVVVYVVTVVGFQCASNFHGMNEKDTMNTKKPNTNTKIWSGTKKIFWQFDNSGRMFAYKLKTTFIFFYKQFSCAQWQRIEFFNFCFCIYSFRMIFNGLHALLPTAHITTISNSERQFFGLSDANEVCAERICPKSVLNIFGCLFFHLNFIECICH